MSGSPLESEAGPVFPRTNGTRCVEMGNRVVQVAGFRRITGVKKEFA
jgi:hypothetical protein